MLRDIKEGKIKAGRDFIVQRDLNIKLTNFGMLKDISKNYTNKDHKSFTGWNMAGTVDYKIIEKNRR